MFLNIGDLRNILQIRDDCIFEDVFPFFWHDVAIKSFQNLEDRYLNLVRLGTCQHTIDAVGNWIIQFFPFLAQDVFNVIIVDICSTILCDERCLGYNRLKYLLDELDFILVQEIGCFRKLHV